MSGPDARATLPRACAAVALIASFATGCGVEDTDRAFAGRLADEHQGETAEPTAAATGEPAQPVVGDSVVYARVDDRDVRGYLARPEDGEAPQAGLIVIHEWWGLNDNIRAMTRRLAGEGFLALAVDLYGGAAAEQAGDAHRLMESAMKAPGAIENNLRQAYEHLTSQGVKRVGTIGWCFGGGWSLNTALMLPDRIDATVIYYGRLETNPDKLAPLTMPILGIFGENDRAIPVETVEAFESALRSLGKDVYIRVYPGADHAFANPSGERYEPDAAADAWRRTRSFLRKHLG